MAHWTEFGVRIGRGPSARRPSELPTRLRELIDERAKHLEEPLAGVTTDGVIRKGLFSLSPSGVSTGPIIDAALAFVAALDPEQKRRLVFPIDAVERRTWLNIHPFVFRHGLMLEDLEPAVRKLALDLLQQTLSARGFAQARDIMRLNGLLGDLSNRQEEFAEWPYFVSFFGEPDPHSPWAWQIDGHHLCANFTIIADQLIFTPTFMGSEPCHVFEGRLAGTTVFSVEERVGLDLIRSLSEDQISRAVLRDSIHPKDLPPEMQHPFDGRMSAGAFHDNAHVPNEGVCGADLSDAQRLRMLAAIAAYVGWASEGHAGVKMKEVNYHLDETYFAWMGSTGDDGPFYYRLQSPVVMIEFDHHPGVGFDNAVPSRNHIHTLIRTPNGGDYGHDLLRQHYEQFDHSSGYHRPRM